MRTIVIRRTGHDLHFHSTRSLEKEGRGVGKWRAIERRSELSDLKLVIGPLLLFAIYIRSYTEPGEKGFHWLLMKLLRCCGMGQAFTWQ